MAVAPAIAVGRGDGRGAERAAVIAALEGEHQALAVLGIAHELEAVLDRLAAADIEVDAALRGRTSARRPWPSMAASSIFSRCRYWLATCGSRSSWRRTAVVEALVAVAEIDGRIPHLQVEVRAPLRVEEERALAALEDLGRIGVVHGVAVRAVPGLELQQLGFRQLGRARSSTLAARASGQSTRLVHACCPQSSARPRRLADVGELAAFEPAGELQGRLVEILKRQMGQMRCSGNGRAGRPWPAPDRRGRRRRSPSGRRPRRCAAAAARRR